MSVTHISPGDIERTNMEIIAEGLARMGVVLSEKNEAVVKRVIHATADFDFARTLDFTPSAVERGIAALHRGAAIITDTNMIMAGLSRPSMEKLDCAAHSYMADEDVAHMAKERGVTRAAVSMERAAAEHPGGIFVIGNAPTALLRLEELIQDGLRPALVIGVPVGFVNVVESKERLLETALACGVPAILSMGRKGGSTVAAAICNALLYTAAGTLDPARRGWG